MSETKLIDIKELKFDEHNFNRHNDEGMSLLEKSIKENGLGRSILLDKDNNIVGGNGVTEKAIELGKTKVRIIETDGTELIAVKRTDLTLDSEQGRKMALADNSVAHANLEWNEEELQKAQDDWGLVPEEWGVELPDFGLSDEQAVKSTVKEDNFEIEDNIDKKVNVGDIWQLGNHRLMCGDSTKAEDVAKLMNGERADLSLTDPPYGVAVVQNGTIVGDKPFGKGTVGGDNVVKANQYAPIIGDETTETARKSYDVMKAVSANQIIFGGNYFTDFLQPKACWLVWDKENTGNFADVELAWTSFDKGEKPVGMLGAIIQDFTKDGAVILDLFGGSGSTLIACQQLNRKCLMMEMSVEYCAIIIARWEQFTKQKAVKL